MSAVTLGGGEIIPATFRPLIEGVSRDAGQAARGKTLLWYLDRHVVVDGDEHGPMAAKLFRSHCMGNDAVHARALEAAARSLGARGALWDEITAGISS